MAYDLFLRIQQSDQGVEIEDTVSGRKICSNENGFAFISGRITANGSDIIAKNKNGLFYTPVLYQNDMSYMAATNGPFYRSDGRTPIELPIASNDSKLRLVLPTLVNNSDTRGPKYVYLMACGENAMKLAGATRGSNVEAFGRFKRCRVGDRETDVLFIDYMLFSIKGGL